MSILGKIIYSSFSSKEKVEKYQQIIRDEEWKILKEEIPKNSYLLDVGCGAGYTMQKASDELGCICKGIDPDPGAHGVGRFLKEIIKKEVIIKANAEKIPFDDKTFDVVFSSHVLEHVNDEIQSLKEMKRVLKDEGILLIGMPTAFMAWMNFISSIIFTTHVKIYHFFRFLLTKKIGTNFIAIFRITSHSYPRAKSIFYDLKHYRISNWKKTISKEFEIVETLRPCLYPFPDYPQLFKIHRSRWGTSSVFFVCKKK